MAQPQNQSNMSVAGAIATGVGALGSALIGTTASSNLNSRNRRWQHDEAELARQRAAEEWQREFDVANEYNTPTSVKQRLAEAGINPNVAFENTQTSAMSNAIPQKSPTYAGAPATFPLQGLAATGGFESAMRSVASLVEAVKTAKLTPALKSQIEADIQSKLARAEVDESQRDLNQFELELNEAYGKQMRSKTLQKLTYETLSAFEDIMLKAKQGQEIDANIYLKKAQELREYAQANLSQTQAQEVEKIISRYDDIANSQIQANRASAYRDVAAGRLSEETAETERQKRPFSVRYEDMRAEGQKLLNEYQNNENWIQSATAVAKVRQFIERANRESLITNQERAKLLQQLDDIVKGHSADARAWVKTILTLGWSE